MMGKSHPFTLLTALLLTPLRCMPGETCREFQGLDNSASALSNCWKTAVR